MRLLRTPVPIWLMLLALSGVAAAGAVLAWREDDDGTRAVTAAASPTPSASATPDVAAIHQAEYRTLAQLAGGLSLARFEEILGTPWFVDKSKDGQFTQQLFRGRDYWVQTVSDAFGTVGRMAITSCSDDFRPSIEGIHGSNPSFGTITLNETRFDQTGARPNTIHYFTSGATADSYYYDEYYFGNPGYYKTYYVGINDACLNNSPRDATFLSPDYSDRSYDVDDRTVAQFRSVAIANTYSETSTFIPEEESNAFPIGASRILTRTAPSWVDP
jgi:hypothetical protein